MAATRFEKIARELPELLSQQMQDLAGRSLKDFSRDKKGAYMARRLRIRQLRSELNELRKGQ